MLDADFEAEGKEFLHDCFDGLTDSVEHLLPSEWAEKVRYLPPHTTSKPGYFRFSVAPYLKEIVDNFAPGSLIQLVDFMKAAQVCATVGVLENIIGYSVDHLKSAPTMFMTADAELAKQRLDLNIMPMLSHSGLSDRIQAVDTDNTRKTGKTEKRIEWQGGGFLLSVGAQNADKLRMQSIRILLQDEVDAYPVTVGKDGDPQKLAEARTKAYFDTRKIFRNSTPLIKGQSRIERGFLAGDQRYYLVPCKECGYMQPLRFSGEDETTKHKFGLVWDFDYGHVVAQDSVKYICANPDCGQAHINDEKTDMLAAGHWHATRRASNVYHRSYQLNALYSPVGFYSWGAIVGDWVEAWDVDNARPKDTGLLQEFYNNNLGESFELIGDKLSFANVSPHRRQAYKFGEINNAYAVEHGGSKILLLTCAVDVQEKYLSVGVMGWSKFSRCWVIEYFDIEGETDDLEGLFSPWTKLRDFLVEARYVSDDGFSYGLAMTLIDSSYRSETVYSFCNQFGEGSGIYPIKGRKQGKKNSIVKEFAQMETSMGVTGFIVTVDLYKDRWYAALKRTWSNVGEQPKGHFNAPVDITDDQLKELTAETKRVLQDPMTLKIVGSEWYRKGRAKNELWDLLGYNNAALDMVAYDICLQQFELEAVNWPAFWDYIENAQIFFSPAS